MVKIYEKNSISLRIKILLTSICEAQKMILFYYSCLDRLALVI